MYHVYIIQSENGRKYIGMSYNFDNRVLQHNKGKSFWTKRYRNWEKIYLKSFKTYRDARRWELYLKRQKGGNGLKKIVEGTNELGDS